METKEFLLKSSKRTIATILGYKEDYCDEYLPENAQIGLRKVIMDEVNRFRELALDLTNDKYIEEWRLELLDKIEDIHKDVKEITEWD